MAEIPSSSFIPKQSQSPLPTGVRRRRTFSIFGFLGTVLLLGSLIFTTGTYFYKGQMYRHLDSVKEQLREQKDLFNDGSIADIERFDRQLKLVSFLLDNHVAPSKLFSELEMNTMEKIQFTNFEYSYDPSFDINITIGGGTQEFRTVALQADVFGRGGIFKDVLFSEIGSDGVTTGSSETAMVASDADYAVHFVIRGVMPPQLLAYDGMQQVINAPASDGPVTVSSEEDGLSAPDFSNAVTP